MPSNFDLTISVVAMTLACAGSGPWTTTPMVAEGARILAVETFGGKSHWNFMSAVIRALLDRGHHVTAFTPFPDGGGGGNPSLGNYTEVDLSGVMPMVLDLDLEDLVRQWGNPVAMVGPVVEMNRHKCNVMYEHPEMKRLLGDGRQGDTDFDVVMIEPTLSECLSYAVRLNRSPLIYVIPFSNVAFVERFSTGHFPNPAVQSPVYARHGRPVTFAQRLTNALLTAYLEIARAYHDAALRRTDPREYDRVEPVPPSLVFANGHFASSAPSAVSADVVNVGGIHLEPAGPLPREILKFIEESPHGVICFTFGSTVKMSALPEHLQKVFFEALAQIPQRVLLKYEIDIEDKPKNVMTLKWLPQRDILVHPNVKLFISHGGISGLYEAVDAGVPVLGFPLFADQHRNIDSLVDVGMAISMNLLTVTKDVFLNNVLELLNNNRYMKNAKIASEVFKDRPLSPAEEVVYWTEYVIRHKGAPHLKSHAINLTWYQYYLLDVIGVVLIFIIVFLFFVYTFLKLIYKYIILNLLRKLKVKSD